MELDQVLRVLKTLDLDVQRVTLRMPGRRVTPDGRELHITIEVTVVGDPSAEHGCRVVAWRDDDPRLMVASTSTPSIIEALATIGDWDELDRLSAPRLTRRIRFDDD